MDRDVALLCNPSAGGGRARRMLPEVQAALDDLGVASYTEITTSLGHARDLACRAAQAGEAVVTLGGDGLAGCVAGVLREHPGSLLGVLPGGRGVVISTLSKPRFLATLPKVFKGAHVTHAAVTVRRARELQVDADRPLTLYADGDPIGETPVTICVVAGAIDVLVPA